MINFENNIYRYKTRLLNISFLLYTFFIFSRISTAGTSISLFLSICSIFLVRIKLAKMQWNGIQLFLAYYIIFFSCLFIAAALSGEKDVLRYTWKYFTWSIPFWVVYIMNSIQSMGNVFIFSATFSSILLGMSCIYSFLSVPIITKNIRIQGFFASPNHLATVLESVIPIIFLMLFKSYREHKILTTKGIFILIGCVVGIFSLAMTQSRGGIFGFVIGSCSLGIAVFLASRFPKYYFKAMIISIIAMVIALGGLYSNTKIFQRSYDMERVLLIESSYKMWTDNQIYGVGLEQWNKVYPQYISPLAKEPNLPMPHNTIAYFFSCTGIIGGIGFLIFTFGTIGLLLNQIKNNKNNIYYQSALWAFIALSIHGMVDVGITNKAAMQIIFGILGMAFSSGKEKGGFY